MADLSISVKDIAKAPCRLFSQRTGESNGSVTPDEVASSFE
jgi:hypothetical protein